MRTKTTSLTNFKSHSHPASKLFRLIELKSIHQLLADVKFSQPSLDLGCGDGFIASILFDRRFTYGLDNNEAGDVKIARQKKLYRKVLIEGAEQSSLPDKSLNFVFSNSVLEHIPPLDDVLKQVSRTLKKDGLFLFTCPSKNFSDNLYVSYLLKKIGLNFLVDKYVNYRNQTLNHYHLYTLEKWQKKLKKYGFKTVRSSYCIAPQTLRLWDKLALLVFILNKFTSKAEKMVYDLFKDQIKQTVKKDGLQGEDGVNLIILAKKV